MFPVPILLSSADLLIINLVCFLMCWWWLNYDVVHFKNIKKLRCDDVGKDVLKLFIILT